MHTIEYTLKQHTPIIHFQYFLHGATLRSTELKSALDKFIIGKNCSCWSSESKDRLEAAIKNNKLKQWLSHSAKPQSPSFDYKVEIINESNDCKVEKTRTLKKWGFFGNQAGEESFEDKGKYKKAVFCEQPIQLILKSVYEDLLSEIDEIIAEFFLLKNFGTRQSKGFGCFYPIEKQTYLEEQKKLPFYFDVDESRLSSTKYKSVFQIINLFYNTLRSGINIPNKERTDSVFYFKSMMWAFAKEQNEQWDKKSIKQKYKNYIHTYEHNKWSCNSIDYRDTPGEFPLGHTDQNIDKNKRKLWRDLLGLSTYEEWGVEKICKDNKEIVRLKSPIIFKPFIAGEKRYRVFFGIDPVMNIQFKNGSKNNNEAEILGEKFNIKFKKKGNLELSFPETFDYTDFTKNSICTYNSNWIEKRFHRTKEFEIINSIYDQLKQQL